MSRLIYKPSADIKCINPLGSRVSRILCIILRGLDYQISSILPFGAWSIMSSLLIRYGLDYHISSILTFSYLEYLVSFIDSLRTTVTLTIWGLHLTIWGLQHQTASYCLILIFCYL